MSIQYTTNSSSSVSVNNADFEKKVQGAKEKVAGSFNIAWNLLNGNGSLQGQPPAGTTSQSPLSYTLLTTENPLDKYASLTNGIIPSEQNWPGSGRLYPNPYNSNELLYDFANNVPKTILEPFQDTESNNDSGSELNDNGDTLPTGLPNYQGFEQPSETQKTTNFSVIVVPGQPNISEFLNSMMKDACLEIVRKLNAENYGYSENDRIQQLTTIFNSIENPKKGWLKNAMNIRENKMNYEVEFDSNHYQIVHEFIKANIVPFLKMQYLK